MVNKGSLFVLALCALSSAKEMQKTVIINGQHYYLINNTWHKSPNYLHPNETSAASPFNASVYREFNLDHLDSLWEIAPMLKSSKGTVYQPFKGTWWLSKSENISDVNALLP